MVTGGRRVIRAMAIASVLLLLGGPVMAMYPAHAMTEYQRGYFIVYKAMYNKGKTLGAQDAREGKSNMADYEASSWRNSCMDVVSKKRLSSGFKQGFCDGVTAGIYDGYNAGYNGR